MPIYEYRCGACGHELEALQKLSDAPLEQCPSCGQNRLTKLVSAAGFQLKGGGWYATDFKNSGKPVQKKNGKGDGATARAEGTTAKSDSAPAGDDASSKGESSTTSGGGCGSGCSCH